MAMHRLAILIALIGLAGVPASPAKAEGPGVRRHGAACLPTGCPGAPRSTAAATAGFAAAVFAARLVARR